MNFIALLVILLVLSLPIMVLLAGAAYVANAYFGERQFNLKILLVFFSAEAVALAASAALWKNMML